MCEVPNSMNRVDDPEDSQVIFPAQCTCGHFYLEKYTFPKPTDQGVIGFCWCGFCRTRLNLYTDGGNNEQDKETTA